MSINRNFQPIRLKSIFQHIQRYLIVASAILIFALFLGTSGYHYIADLSWIDSLLNASMILTGMGPVDPMKTDLAKLFASFYALFSGLVFALSFGLVISPLIHRILHNFHIEN